MCSPKENATMEVFNFKVFAFLQDSLGMSYVNICSVVVTFCVCVMPASYQSLNTSSSNFSFLFAFVLCTIKGKANHIKYSSLFLP